MNGGGQEGTAAVGSSREPIGEASYHSMEMNIAPREHDDYISRLKLRVIHRKADDHGLTVLLLHCFVGKTVGINYVRL